MYEKKSLQGYAILNSNKDVWIPEIFDTPEAAREFLLKTSSSIDLRFFSLVRATKTVEVFRAPKDPEIIAWPITTIKHWLKARVIPGSGWVEVSRDAFLYAAEQAGFDPRNCTKGFVGKQIKGIIRENPPGELS